MRTDAFGVVVAACLGIVIGLLIGFGALFATLWIVASKLPQ